MTTDTATLAIPDWLVLSQLSQLETPSPNIQPSSPNESLSPPVPQKTPSARQVECDKRDIRLLTYAAFFEHALTDIAEGAALPALCQQDPRGISPARFLSWILRDPERKRRYHDALATNAEIVFSEIIDIADAKHNPMEDVQRSTLKIKTRQWWLGVVDKERFGDIKRLDVTTKTLDAEKLRTISTDDLKQMVISGEYRVVSEDNGETPE